MALRDLPLLRQLQGDHFALGRAAQSKRSESLRARITDADRVVQSVCPYGAAGCGQRVYVKDERITRSRATPRARSRAAG
jgi:formate dehydrogenase major subunit